MSTKLKYPYHWGAGVVNAFVEKYARGTYYLAKLLGISEGALRHQFVLIICSGKSLKWEGLKALVKSNDVYFVDDLTEYSSQERKVLYRCLVHMAYDEVLDKIIENSPKKT